MKYIELPDDIPKRKQTYLSRRSEAVNNLEAVREKKDYISARGHNTWRILKIWLANLSDDKCWYCESKILRPNSDVDHFRPKAGVTCERQPLAEHDGYYWLAYDWQNFRLSCACPKT